MNFAESVVPKQRPRKGHSSEIERVLNGFLESDYKTVVITDWRDTYKNQNTMYQAFKKKMSKNATYQSITLRTRQGNIFLTKN